MPFDKDVWAWRLSGHNLHIDKGTAAAEPTHILYLWSHSRLAAALLDRACQQAHATLPPDICAPVSCRIELPLMQTVWVFFKQSMNSISQGFRCTFRTLAQMLWAFLVHNSFSTSRADLPQVCSHNLTAWCRQCGSLAGHTAGEGTPRFQCSSRPGA